jgi:hypothetical protein
MCCSGYYKGEEEEQYLDIREDTRVYYGRLRFVMWRIKRGKYVAVTDRR